MCTSHFSSIKMHAVLMCETHPLQLTGRASQTRRMWTLESLCCWRSLSSRKDPSDPSRVILCVCIYVKHWFSLWHKFGSCRCLWIWVYALNFRGECRDLTPYIVINLSTSIGVCVHLSRHSLECMCKCIGFSNRCRCHYLPVVKHWSCWLWSIWLSDVAILWHPHSINPNHPFRNHKLTDMGSWVCK